MRQSLAVPALATPVPARRFGLGARLAAVVACAMLPALILVALWADERRQAAVEAAEHWTQEAAKDAATEHAAFYHQVRATLEMLSIAPAVRHGDAERCNELLVETQRRRAWMGAAWLVEADGTVVCATDPTAAPPAIDAAARARMAAEEFDLSDVHDASGMPVLLAAMRVPAVAGGRHMIVETRIGLDALTHLATLAEAPDAGVIISVDRGGHALTTTAGVTGIPAPGQHIADHPVVRALLRASGQPIVGAVHDGITRIFTSAVVPGWGATVIVGIGQDTVLATSGRSLTAALAVGMFVLLLTAGISWLTADRLIMRFVRVVRDAAVQMAAGATGRRAEVGNAPREIRDLAAAFNDMTERLESLALHDQLTGLPNRRYLNSRLAEMTRVRMPLALMIVDADDFKLINDGHGHAVGDAVLKAIAERLLAAVGDDGFCARIGGDEFVVVVTASNDNAVRLRAIAASERIRKLLGDPVVYEGHRLMVTATIGVAVHDNGVADLIELFHNADRALYAAKAAGRNCTVLFDGTQPDVISQRREMRASRIVAA